MSRLDFLLPDLLPCYSTKRISFEARSMRVSWWCHGWYITCSSILLSIYKSICIVHPSNPSSVLPVIPSSITTIHWVQTSYVTQMHQVTWIPIVRCLNLPTSGTMWIYHQRSCCKRVAFHWCCVPLPSELLAVWIGDATLLTRHSIDHKETVRATLDLFRIDLNWRDVWHEATVFHVKRSFHWGKPHIKKPNSQHVTCLDGKGSSTGNTLSKVVKT